MNAVKTSARNQFAGKIKKITMGAVNAEIILDLNGQELAAVITIESSRKLGLKEGMEAYALIKASWVILAIDNDLKVSARNALPGVITEIEKGAVNTEVDVKLNGGQNLTAIITNKSAEALALKKDDKVTALIKASNIVIAVKA